MAEKASRQERISGYREVSRSADGLVDGRDVKGALRILEMQKKKAEAAGDDYAAFFAAEIHFYRDKDYARAVQVLSSVIDRARDDNFLLRMLGDYMCWTSQEDEAIKCYDRALEVNPQDADAMKEKGIVLSNRGREDEAIKWFDKALEINPHDPDTITEKELCLSKKGQKDEVAERPQPQTAAAQSSPDQGSSADQYVITFVIFLLIIGFLMYRDWNGPAGKADYDQVRVGMSLAEVETVFGKKLSIPDSQRAHFTGSAKWYSSDYLQAVGPGKIWKEINVDFRDGVVVSKSRLEK